MKSLLVAAFLLACTSASHADAVFDSKTRMLLLDYLQTSSARNDIRPWCYRYIRLNLAENGAYTVDLVGPKVFTCQANPAWYNESDGTLQISNVDSDIGLFSAITLRVGNDGKWAVLSSKPALAGPWYLDVSGTWLSPASLDPFVIKQETSKIYIANTYKGHFINEFAGTMLPSGQAIVESLLKASGGASYCIQRRWVVFKWGTGTATISSLPAIISTPTPGSFCSSAGAIYDLTKQ